MRVAWPGAITRLSKAPANTHELHLLPDLLEGTSGIVIGDRNYHSPPVREDLARGGVELLTPYSSKKRDPNPQRSALLSRLRYRIDTVFSQLTERYCVKSGCGHVTCGTLLVGCCARFSHTVAFLLNYRVGNPPLQLSKLLT